MRCTKCGLEMRKIGGWKEDSSEAELDTFWCDLCRKVEVEEPIDSTVNV